MQFSNFGFFCSSFQWKYGLPKVIFLFFPLMYSLTFCSNSVLCTIYALCSRHLIVTRRVLEIIRNWSSWVWCLKALANEDTLLRTHCCPWCFLGCANWETFVADTKCFWTKSETFFVSRTQNLCPQQMLRARANGETFVSATMCPQQCVLVC